MRKKQLFIAPVLGLTLLLTLQIILGNSPSAITLAASSKVKQKLSSVITVCPVDNCDYKTIQAAVDAAKDGDLIKVATGTYTDTNIRSRRDVTNTGLVTQVVYINKTVTLQGGYRPPNWDTSDPVANPTTFDAQGQGRVIYISGDIAPTLVGFRLQGGNAIGLGGHHEFAGYDAGGGIYIITATVTIRDNDILDNHISGYRGYGGGLALIEGKALLERNTFIGNTSANAGGLFVWSGQATLVDNTISENNSGGGGGLLVRTSIVTLTGNTVTANRAMWGGGLYMDEGSTAILSNNTFARNTVYHSGGGLYLATSQARLFRNAISANSVDMYYGGGLYLCESTAELNGNFIGHNDAPFGGGVSACSSAILLNGNMVISNTADFGGGLNIEKSRVTSTNEVILDNGESGLRVSGSILNLSHATIGHNNYGLYVTDYVEPAGPPPRRRTYSLVVLTNTILVSHTVGIEVIAGNAAQLNGVLWFSNGLNTRASGAITVTHALTGVPAFYSDGYHLRSNSPAIDAGVTTGVSLDVDNQLRPYLAPDLGADEYWPPGLLKQIYLPLVLSW